jgi:multidrug efflux pump subunit AcrA (membrane-fusion protein)
MLAPSSRPLLAAAFLVSCASHPSDGAKEKRPPPSEVWIPEAAARQLEVEPVARRRVHDSIQLGGEVAIESEGTVRFHGEVPEVYVGDLELGRTVVFRAVSLPQTSFEGTLDRRSEGLDPVRRTVSVRATLLDPGRRLISGATGVATIWTREFLALAVRPEAVVRKAGAEVVYIDRGLTPERARRFEARPVALEQAGEWMRVLSGLDEGEPVVVSGGLMLAEQR